MHVLHRNFKLSLVLYLYNKTNNIIGDSVGGKEDTIFSNIFSKL